MKIVGIIPAYNEIENIARTITALLDVFEKLKNHDMHVLVIDSDSTDGTAAAVREIGQSSRNVHLLEEGGKSGIGSAYTMAMAHAFGEMQADAIFTFDADLSHDPSILPRLVEHLEKGAKHAIGTRYMEGGSIPQEWQWYRKLLSTLGNGVLRFIFREYNVTDYTSGYKIFTREVYDVIKHELGKHQGYVFTISITLESLRNGIAIAQVPYHFSDRQYGKSKMALDYMFLALIHALKERLRLFMHR